MIFRLLPIQKSTTAFNYVAGIFENVPRLADMVTNKTADVLSLCNGVDIEVQPANFNTIRSITAVAALADEMSFWRNYNFFDEPASRTSRLRDRWQSDRVHLPLWRNF